MAGWHLSNKLAGSSIYMKMIHLSMIMAPAQREMKTSSSAERIILLIAWLCFPRKNMVIIFFP